MPLNTVSVLTNAVQVAYRSGYMLAAMGEPVWGRLVQMWEEISEGRGGSAFNYAALEEMPVALTALTEDSDVVPQLVTDDSLTVTPNEYGNSAAPSRKARWQSRVNLIEGFGKLIGQNQARSVDRLIRNGILGGSNVRYPGSVAARTSLDATSDLPTYDFLLQLVADAISAGLEPYEGDVYAAPVHPLLLRQLLLETTIKALSTYREDVELVFKGLPGFTVAGIRFIPHKWGKVYLSGGTTAQAATTLAADAAAGATTITITLDTGLAIGDYVTIGTLEANDAEEVQITSIAATPVLSIVGGGNKPSNIGLKYAHSSGAAVTEAANVCAIPIIGRNSVRGVHGDVTGRYGMPIVKEGLDLLDRFVYQSWYWYGGIGVWNRYVIRGECAVAGGIRGGE